ncbi:TPA: DNA methyltransferase [Stenotrophomonas maltophilia]
MVDILSESNQGTAVPRRASQSTQFRQHIDAYSTSIAEAASKHTAKRDAANLEGLEHWLPYYAGYTESFARTLIQAASLDGRKLTVLDPWNGSGTTTRAAIELGHAGLGCDINPVATLAASAKLANAQDAMHVSGLVQHLAKATLEASISPIDPLLAWLPRSAVKRFRAIQRGILTELSTSPNGEVLSPNESAIPPLASFLLLALIRAARTIATFKPSSNPTWSRSAGVMRRYQAGRIEHEWALQVRTMADDLAKACASFASGAGAMATIELANSKSLPFQEESVDFVLTSPPYCTRIDYAKGTSFELAALGVSEATEDYRTLRLNAMGTPLSRPGGEASADTRHSDEVVALLASIKSHPSKASSTYYHRTYAQYFTDCHTSLSEIMRVLKPGGIAALIVQSSYYKEIYVDLPQLYVSEATRIGFDSSVAGVTKVSRAFSQMNPKSSAYMQKKSYEESVVLLKKSASGEVRP